MRRPFYTAQVVQAFRVNPVVGLLGPRQCGKTTLARQFARLHQKSSRGQVAYFDLENPLHQARMADPLLALESLQGWVIIDEVQRAPGLFEVLRVLVDRR